MEEYELDDDDLHDNALSTLDDASSDEEFTPSTDHNNSELPYLLNCRTLRAFMPLLSSEYPSLESEASCSHPQRSTDTLMGSEFHLMTTLASGSGSSSRYLPSEYHISGYLTHRERGLGPYANFSPANRCKINNSFLPNTIKIIDYYNGKIFCGIFSKDGKYFLTASQDRQVRLYNSERPNYSLINTYKARDIGWSIIDVAFSPSQEHFVYSTWSCALHLCSIKNDDIYQRPICLSSTHQRFCVFCVAFSSNGKEILGGANDGCMYIYDLERGFRILKIMGHEFDVNSVAYADESSNIIYSGCDGALVKVWDRRTLNESSPKPVGILAGHKSGITFIDSRGDGRHLISNSKDQSIKLWDIRIFASQNAIETAKVAASHFDWDYRWQQVPRKLASSRKQIDGDTSVMTYRGHTVIKTLVRCRFSPSHTTGQKYIYTGSGTGGLIVYDSLTGEIALQLKGQKGCVRDVSWHPYRNEILTSCWDGTVGQWVYADKDATKNMGLFSGLRSNIESSCSIIV